MTNFRTAKYMPDGTAIDDPNDTKNIAGDNILLANLPAPDGIQRVVKISDVGPHGSWWSSDGLSWGLVNGVCVLAQSAVAVSVSAASTAEEVLAEIALPAGVLGLNGGLRLVTLWSMNSNANVKTVRARLGATALGGSAWLANATGPLNNVSFQNPAHVIRNRGVVNSQVCFPAANGSVGASSGTALSTFTEDTSVATIVAITGQKATGADTLTLEGYTLELLRP